jgi:hypothetical protein
VRLGRTQAADFFAQYIHQLGLRVWAAIGEPVLEKIPDAFVGVQFWRIGGERHQMETASAGKEFLNRIAAMDVAVVQKNDEMASYGRFRDLLVKTYWTDRAVVAGKELPTAAAAGFLKGPPTRLLTTPSVPRSGRRWDLQTGERPLSVAA